MSDGRNKYQSRENQHRIRCVLNEHWDPIGVVEIFRIDDEYDSYVGTVYVMLMDHRANQEAITDYLYQIATVSMGLSPSPSLAEKCENTAAILVGLRLQFETH